MHLVGEPLEVLSHLVHLATHLVELPIQILNGTPELLGRRRAPEFRRRRLVGHAADFGFQFAHQSLRHVVQAGCVKVLDGNAEVLHAALDVGWRAFAIRHAPFTLFAEAPDRLVQLPQSLFGTFQSLEPFAQRLFRALLSQLLHAPFGRFQCEASLLPRPLEPFRWFDRSRQQTIALLGHLPPLLSAVALAGLRMFTIAFPSLLARAIPVASLGMVTGRVSLARCRFISAALAVFRRGFVSRGTIRDGVADDGGGQRRDDDRRP